MAETVCSNSICLRVIDFSETSQIVTLLTASHGVVGMIAKGIRKIPKKSSAPLMAPLDVLSAGQVVFIPARQDGQLATLTAWDVTDHRPDLRQHYKKIITAQLLAQVTIATGASDEVAEDMLRQLERTIGDLAATDSLRPVVAYLKYSASVSGYALDLIRCAGCKEPLGLHASIQRQSVGLFCDLCRRSDPVACVDRRILSALNRLPSPCDLPEPEHQAPADPAALYQAAQLLLFHLRAVLDDHLRLIESFQPMHMPPSVVPVTEMVVC